MAKLCIKVQLTAFLQMKGALPACRTGKQAKLHSSKDGG
jgi:hypothetical protein